MEFQKIQKVEFKKKSAKKMYETQQNLPKRKKEKRKKKRGTQHNHKLGRHGNCKSRQNLTENIAQKMLRKPPKEKEKNMKNDK